MKGILKTGFTEHKITIVGLGVADGLYLPSSNIKRAARKITSHKNIVEKLGSAISFLKY